MVLVANAEVSLDLAIGLMHWLGYTNMATPQSAATARIASAHTQNGLQLVIQPDVT